VATFNRNDSYPIGVKADTEGKVKFMIDGLENFDENEEIFIMTRKMAAITISEKKRV
jgi:3-deoxy-D-arabino-heptulosonate 7-phosphate (DAHP) synthase